MTSWSSASCMGPRLRPGRDQSRRRPFEERTSLERSITSSSPVRIASASRATSLATTCRRAAYSNASIAPPRSALTAVRPCHRLSSVTHAEPSSPGLLVETGGLPHQGSTRTLAAEEVAGGTRWYGRQYGDG